MPNETQFVDQATLLRLFNETTYSLSAETGEFQTEVVYEGTPRPSSGQTHGTRSQRVQWYDSSGNWVATVHQFVKPDGSLGGGGKPDPKRVRIGNVVYVLQIGSTPKFRGFFRRRRR